MCSELLLKKMPLHFGGISDPFSDSESCKISLKLLKLFNEFNYPIVLSTKNTNFLMKDETIKILKEIKYLIIQISFSIPNDFKAKKIESKAPLPSSRIKTISFLSKEGFSIVARLQPLLIPWINNIHDELIPQLGKAGCRHIVIEFLKLPVEHNISQISKFYKSINWNAFKEYQELNAHLVGREWLLPNKLKWDLLQVLINQIHQYKMTYGSADYGLNHLGDTDCCCGLDLFNGFENWFKGNFAYIIRKNKKEKIFFNSVRKNWFPSKSIRRIIILIVVYLDKIMFMIIYILNGIPQVQLMRQIHF